MNLGGPHWLERVARINEPVKDSDESDNGRRCRRDATANDRAIDYGYVDGDIEGDMPQDRIKKPPENDGKNTGKHGNAVPIKDTFSRNGVENLRKTSTKCFEHAASSRGWRRDYPCHADVRRRGLSAETGKAIYLPRCGVTRPSCKGRTCFVAEFEAEFEATSAQRLLSVIQLSARPDSCVSFFFFPQHVKQSIQSLPNDVLVEVELIVENAATGSGLNHAIILRDYPDKNAAGKNIVIPGLWGIEFGGGSSLNGKTNQLFLTAGPNDEDGYFGVINFN